MKRCVACDDLKPPVEFSVDRSRPDGRNGYCRACDRKKSRAWKAAHKPEIAPKMRSYHKRNPEKRRAMELKRRYGITLEQYYDLILAQEARCAACGDDLPEDRAPSVDHCHDTGKVRGILCNACNVSVGYMRNDPQRCLRLAKYLGWVEIE